MKEQLAIHIEQHSPMTPTIRPTPTIAIVMTWIGRTLFLSRFRASDERTRANAIRGFYVALVAVVLWDRNSLVGRVKNNSEND